jgi:2-polyprenyl-3-methyl-5-hydroxy-6-metoxy-1,4-benzoquinol methylase
VPISAELETADCLFCAPGTPAAQLFDDPPFAVLRCSGCGLVFVSPRIAAGRLGDVYDETYWRSPAPRDRGYADYRAEAARWLRTYRLRAKLLEGRLAPRSRIIDVGCAAGYFGQVMRAHGHEVWGIEPSSAIAGEALRRLGNDRVHPGTLADAPWPPGSFDLITLWDVVEHLPDPVAALGRARELLRPGGLLLIETQNVESRFARMLGRRWQHFKQAEHLWHFSPATLTRLLHVARFAPVETTARRAGKFVGLDFVAERSARLHPALATALRPLGKLPGAIYVNLFDELVAIARAAPEG